MSHESVSPLKVLLVLLLLGPLAGCEESQTPEQQSTGQHPQESQQAEQLPETQSPEPATADESAESEQATQPQWQPESP